MTRAPNNVLFPEFRRRKADCQRERPFLVVRTTAAGVLEGLRKAADEELLACEERMKFEAAVHVTLSCSHAKSAHYLRCLANRIEMEGSDAS